MSNRKKGNSNYKKIINRIKIAMIVIACVILCVLQFFALVKGNNYKKYILTEDVIVKNNGKKVFQGNIDEYDMKDIKSEDNITMHMKIPKNKLKSPAIQYDNINTAVKVYVDGKKIYSIGEGTPKGGVVCHVYNKVPLGDISDKTEIVMSIRVLSGITLIRLPRVTMMNTYDVDEEYYYAMHVYIVIGYYLAIIGILGIIIVSFVRKKDMLKMKTLALSITSILAAIYMISTFQVIPLFSDNYILDAYFEYGSRLYLPFMLNMYMFYEYPKGKRKISVILAIITGLYATSLLILQGMHVMYINDTLSLFLVLYIITGINIVVYYIKYKSALINKKIVVSAIGGVLALVMVYTVVVVCFPNYSDYFLIIIPLAILVVLTTFFMELVSEITKDMISDAKKKALEDMAYLDGLTRIHNRRGFDKYLKYDIKNNCRYMVYSFDLNRLKYVNDTYGHDKGDEYIRTFATSLSRAFENGFCARVGGDEFIAMSLIELKNGGLFR